MAIPLLVLRGLDEIQTVEKPTACVNCDEFKKKDGYVAIFINNNGIGHAALFVGRASNKNWLLFDPCGSYAKGAGYNRYDNSTKIRTRTGDVMLKGEFSARDYYLYQRYDGPKVNVYAFEITKEEEVLIRDNIDEYADSSCFAKCSEYVAAVLYGIKSFKGLDSRYRFPWTLESALKKLTKMSTSNEKESVILRLSGENDEAK